MTATDRIAAHLQAHAGEKSTYRQRVAELFTDHPGRWIDGVELAAVGGRYAWRSRVSDCRLALGMSIENRQRTVTLGNGDVFTASEYRYLPPAAPARAHEAHEYQAQPELF